jgi:4-amino-4-deoxy-L-arabinose transferase-like glycosyltransferase
MVGLFTAALAVRIACFTGLVASDDLGYSGYALQIARGTYHLEPHHYAIRYGLLLPVAAAYRVFGAYEWTTVLFPLLFGSLACVVAAEIARRYGGIPAAWIAGMLMVTFPIDVRYSTVLTPEPMCQLVLLLAALLYLQSRESGSRLGGLAAGACFGVAYLTKEPAAFVAVVFVVFALWTRRWALATQVAVGAGLVVAGELAWYWSQSHDLLFRPHAMAVHNRSEMAVEANAELSWRLWKAYPRMMILPNVHFGLHSLFALVLAGYASVRNRFDGDTRLFVLWALVPFLYLDFGSSSFTYYWALPLAPRYISLIYPPLFILSAMSLVRWWNGSSRARLISVGSTAIVCAVGIAAALSTRGTGYGTETVKRLKTISAAAATRNERICVTARDSASWRQLLRLLAPNQLGCAGERLIQLRMDATGRPVGVPLATDSAPGRGTTAP